MNSGDAHRPDQRSPEGSATRLRSLPLQKRLTIIPISTFRFSTRNSLKNPLKACRNHFIRSVTTAPLLRHKGAVDSRFHKQRYKYLPPKGAVGGKIAYVLRPFLGYRTLNAGPRLRGHPRAWNGGAQRAARSTWIALHLQSRILVSHVHSDAVDLHVPQALSSA